MREISAFPAGTVDISDGWRFRLGDDPAFARPDYDDSAWRVVNLRFRPALAGPGMRWYRMHLKLPTSHPPEGLLLGLAPSGCEVFVNNAHVGEGRIGPPMAWRGPDLQALQLPDARSDLLVAVRCDDPTFVNVSDNMEGFGSATAAPWPVTQDLAAASTRWPVLTGGASIGIDFTLCVGGLAVFGLFFAERRQREYLWLGSYLVALGLSDMCYQLAEGFLPLVFNLYQDVLNWFIPLLQVEFTYAFVGKRVPKPWRLYQALLLACIPAGYWISWHGLIPRIFYTAVALLSLPAAVFLPVLLIRWYRRGHREAGWLIVPSLLPGLGQGLYLAQWMASVMFQSHRADFLLTVLRFNLDGAVFQLPPIMNLSFLVAIGIVLFLRHTRLTREQERTAAELQAASEIQNRLVPVELPEIAGCQIRAAYVPAAEVGGDFFQVLLQDDGSTLIAVGDVSGKGLRAAMTGALAIGALRTLADEGIRPASVLSAMNRQLVRAGQGGFVTLLCARLDRDGTMTLANAGHLYPYRNGMEMELETGMPLGLADGAEYGETTVHLEPGDSITFLSDGVVEARKPDGELFGFERTQAISVQSPQEIAEAAQQFGQEDDITVVTLTLAPVSILA